MVATIAPPATATTSTVTAAVNEPATATSEATAVSLYGFVTPTPIAGAQETEFRPGTGDVGWWTDGPDGQINLNDSYLYAGALDGQNYLAAARFDLKRIPRGTPILGGELRLTGLRADQFDPNAGGTWLVQLLGQSELSTLGGANFMMIYSAPASVTLLPQLTSAEVSVGGVNRWVFDANTLQWIEQQRLNGADTIVARIVGATNPGGQSLFGWDSGIGPTSAGDGPVLALSLGPAPTETPPAPDS
ncbi:MAG: hypothetical protein IPK16_11100 [Anaerolineales bacterium]|nr:hypothetical protein [Anaerolineales bacterium]